MLSRGELYISTGVLLEISLLYSVFLPYTFFTDEIQHMVAGIGLAFIVVGISLLTVGYVTTETSIIAILTLAITWEIFEIVQFGGVSPGGNTFIFWFEDTLLDISLATSTALITKEILDKRIDTVSEVRWIETVP